MIVKTCPFCGGMPYIEEHSRGYVNGQSTRVCYVRCKECNARSPRVDLKDYGVTSHSPKAIQDVVDAWNKSILTIKPKLVSFRRRRRLLKILLDTQTS